MSRLIAIKTWFRFSDVRICNRWHYEVTEADGASADHDAYALLTALFQPGRLITHVQDSTEIGTVLTRVEARAVLPERSSAWQALPPLLPRNGNKVENAQLPQLAVRISFGKEGGRSMRAGVQFPAPGYQDVHRNEIIDTFREALEELATEFINPHLMPTGQTYRGAVLNAQGIYAAAANFRIGNRPTTQSTRRRHR